MVFRDIREFPGHLRIQHREERVHARGEDLYLRLQCFILRAGDSLAMAALAETDRHAAAYHIFPGAEGCGHIQHHIFVGPIENAEGCRRLAAIVADGAGQIPLGVSVEIQRLQVRHSRCIGAHLIDLGLQVSLHVVQLPAIHGVGAGRRHVPIR